MAPRTKQELAVSAQVAGEYRRKGYGKDTPIPARKMLAREMAEQGATMADIGRVFGVTPQAVRHWVRERRPVYLSQDEIDLVMAYREKMARFGR